MKIAPESISKAFKEQFGKEPLLIKSPGRVNLIGEHTDYNNGFVLPASIDKKIILAMAPNQANCMHLVAVDVEQEFEASLENNFEKSKLHWPDYIMGIADQLRDRGYKIGGFDCLFGGDIPIGAGLSSSAALEGGVLLGLSEIFGLNLSRLEMAEIGRQAENEFVGVQCGIMDQFANLHGKTGNVIKLDCRTLDYSHHSFAREDISILLCDTNVRRALASSEYNIRRKQCETGVEILREYDAALKTVRDVSLQLLEQHKDELPDVIYQRCRYVLEENQRVLDACSDLEKGDIHSFGRRMYQSHDGLRDQYEVSCRELDLLVKATENMDEVYGSRMMGGGFGGCTINLVLESEVEPVKKRIQKTYKKEFNSPIEFYHARISEGTNVLA